MAIVFTTDKIIIIVGVTIVVIILAYIFRFGQFRRLKKAGTPPNSSAPV